MNTWIAGSRPLKTATSSLPWPRNRTLKGQHNEAALKQMGRRWPSPCLAYFHRSTPNLQLEHWPWRMLVAQWTLTLHAGLIYLRRSPWELGQTSPVVGKGVRVTIQASHNQVRSENILQGHLVGKVLAPTLAYLPTVKTDSETTLLWNTHPGLSV